MVKPIVSIDVAKGKSVAAAFLSHGEMVQKPFSFYHSLDGLQPVISLLEQLESTTSVRPVIVLEATGHYSKNLISHFHSLGYPVVILNPLQTHHLKGKSIRKVKSDPVDTYRIAEAFYLGHGALYKPSEDSIQTLRTLARQYDHLNTLYAEIQLHFRSVLDLVFPDFDHVFKRLCTPTSLRILNACPTPQALLSANQEELLNTMMQNRKGRPWNERKLHALVQKAQNSLPDRSSMDSYAIMLKHYIHLLHTHKQMLDDLEKTMINVAAPIPSFSLLCSIPGVGPKTAMVIMSEVGDIKNFPSSKQLTAFAGLDSSVYESGNFKATNNHISKRGSSYLRKALYQATVAGISNQIHGPRNVILSQFYTKKLAEGKHKKAAIIATSNKLLRMIYGIWSSQTPFKAI